MCNPQTKAHLKINFKKKILTPPLAPWTRTLSPAFTRALQKKAQVHHLTLKLIKLRYFSLFSRNSYPQTSYHLPKEETHCEIFSRLQRIKRLFRATDKRKPQFIYSFNTRLWESIVRQAPCWMRDRLVVLFWEAAVLGGMLVKLLKLEELEFLLDSHRKHPKTGPL